MNLTTGPSTAPAAARLAVAVSACIALAITGCAPAVDQAGSARPPGAGEQAGPALRIGGGTGPAGPWTVWVHPTANGHCVSLVDPVVEDPRMCSMGGEPFDGSIGLAAQSGAELAIIYGSTSNPEAVSAVVTTKDGRVTRATIERPAGTGAAGHGYFVVRDEPGAEFVLVSIVDAAGIELERYPMGRP